MIENILVEILATASAARFSAQQATRIAARYQPRIAGDLRHIVVESTLLELYARRLLQNMLSSPNEWRDVKQGYRSVCASLRVLKKAYIYYTKHHPSPHVYTVYLALLRNLGWAHRLARTKKDATDCPILHSAWKGLQVVITDELDGLLDT
jgi:hypothetical protein